MDPRSLRACDRCAQLKAQCSAGEDPCSRCRRLSLCCTRDRPLPTRGRPRKNRADKTNARRPSTSASIAALSSSDSSDHGTSTSLDPATDFLLASIDLPVARPLAVSLLNGVLDVAHSVGVLSAFRRQHHQLLAKSDEGTILAVDREHELSFLGSRSILCALLACATLFIPGEFPRTLAEDCRMYALSDVPILTWKSRAVSRNDAYCLFLLSSAGYLQKDMTEMAARWVMLSEMLAFTALPPAVLPTLMPPGVTDGPIELDRRISSLVALNSEVQRVLYYRPSGSQEPRPQALGSLDRFPRRDENHGQMPTVPDVVWHRLCPPGQDDAYPHATAPLDQGFFDLFMPLQALLRASLSTSYYGDISQSPVANGLETYFVTFPPAIMELADVSLPWQLEAMIWFHGIYLLLTCGPDLFDIMNDAGLVNSGVFAHAADHAILLGEILPYLAGLQSAILRVMPLSIYFIVLSAAVHIGLLRHVYNSHDAPPLLIDSAQKHSRALNKILEVSRTCDHPVVKCVATIMSMLLSAQPDGSATESEQLSFHMEQLQSYRWVPGGRGILPLDSLSAQTLAMHSWASTGIGISLAGPSLELQTVLNPNSRVNKPGTFDLSILY